MYDKKTNHNTTLFCRFSNCKLAVQYKVGLWRLAQLGYWDVHRWGGTLYCAEWFGYAETHRKPWMKETRLTRLSTFAFKVSAFVANCTYILYLVHIHSVHIFYTWYISTLYIYSILGTYPLCTYILYLVHIHSVHIFYTWYISTL